MLKFWHSTALTSPINIINEIYLAAPEVLNMEPLRREGRVFYNWITTTLEKYGVGLPYIRISELEDVAAPVSSSAIPLLSHLAKKLAGDRSTTIEGGLMMCLSPSTE